MTEVDKARKPEIPAFRLLLPTGWEQIRVSEESEREILARLRAKVKKVGRPDLDFTLTATLKSAFRQLRSVDSVAIYLPLDVAPDALLPMSITASQLVDPAGNTLDHRVAEVFRDFGGTFLGEDRKIVRWRRSKRHIEGFPEAINEQINYIIPVPGSARRRALLFSTSILQDAESSVDEDRFNLMVLLSDSIIGNFTWNAGLPPEV
ncbi:MAG: hypothetical protein ACOH19_10000 [Rhodoglobus sp.]